MLSVTKGLTEGARIGRGAGVFLFFVAHTARGNLAAGSGFAARRVAGVTLAVRRGSGRNRQRRTAIERTIMTSDAAILRSRRARHVLRVIELQVETLFEVSGKESQRWPSATHVGMTDGAHRRAGG